MPGAHIKTLCAILLYVDAFVPLAVKPAAAQLDSGAVVRVTTDPPSSRSLVGTVVSLRADSLTVNASKDGSVVAVPVSSIVRVEQSRGRRSNAGRGATIGGLIGAGTGLALGILASTEEGGFYEVGAEDVVAVAALLGGAGAGIGALIGATSHREKWEPASLPGKRASRASPGRVVNIGLAVPF